MDARDKFEAAFEAASRRFPFLPGALYALRQCEVKGLGTLAVSKDGILLYDLAAIDNWTVAQSMSVLAHEVEHLLRGHHDRGSRIGVDPKTANIAGDMEINSNLQDAKLDLPDPLLPEQFGFPPGLTLEEYVLLIAKQRGKEGGQEGDGRTGTQQREGKGKGKGKGKDPSGGQAKGPPQAGQHPGQGHCGSCVGEERPEEAEARKKVGGLTEARVERMRDEVAQAIQEQIAQKGQGSVPEGWSRWANLQLTPPKVPWEQKLARACRNAVQTRAGASDFTYRRTSRMQAGVGYGPGIPRVAGLNEPVPRVWFAVDTSGSMGDEECAKAVSEGGGVLQTLRGDVRYIAIDADIHTFEDVGSTAEMLKKLRGGGGTSFIPVFEKIGEVPRHDRPAILIYVTDGMGDAPAAPPPGLQVIWVLIGPKHRPCSWGEFIEI